MFLFLPFFYRDTSMDNSNDYVYQLISSKKNIFVSEHLSYFVNIAIKRQFLCMQSFNFHFTSNK